MHVTRAPKINPNSWVIFRSLMASLPFQGFSYLMVKLGAMLAGYCRDLWELAAESWTSSPALG